MALLLVSWPARAHAEEPQPPPFRALVRVAGDDDDAIVERLRGHVSDLAVDLVVVKGELEPTERKRRAAAARLAREDEQHARAVVWFTPLKKGGFRVHVADVERKQLLARDVEPDKGKLDRSALLETAALVVRSAFFAMQEGEDIGPPEQFTDEEQPLQPKPPPPPPPRPPFARAELAAGLAWAYDHGSTRGYPGISVRAGLVHHRFALELGAAAALPARIHGEFADVSLWRAPLTLALAARVAQPSPHLALEVALSGTLVLYDRRTDAVFGGATATPAAFSAGGVGAEFRLQFQIVQRVSMELSAGVDVVVNAPELNYQDGDQSLEFATLWVVQPRVGLNLLFR